MSDGLSKSRGAILVVVFTQCLRLFAATHTDGSGVLGATGGTGTGGSATAPEGPRPQRTPGPPTIESRRAEIARLRLDVDQAMVDFETLTLSLQANTGTSARAMRERAAQARAQVQAFSRRLDELEARAQALRKIEEENRENPLPEGLETLAGIERDIRILRERLRQKETEVAQAERQASDQAQRESSDHFLAMKAVVDGLIANAVAAVNGQGRASSSASSGASASGGPTGGLTLSLPPIPFGTAPNPGADSPKGFADAYDSAFHVAPAPAAPASGNAPSGSTAAPLTSVPYQPLNLFPTTRRPASEKK